MDVPIRRLAITAAMVKLNLPGGGGRVTPGYIQGRGKKEQ